MNSRNTEVTVSLIASTKRLFCFSKVPTVFSGTGGYYRMEGSRILTD